ncbi:MAG TPA: PilZ domain-containing protein [Nitrospira sp.]|nr:PilZ domain-containing protein [Nitrospira sp.]
MNPPYSRHALNSRLAERWSVHYKVQFAYPEYAGEGVTLDVSAGGFCVITNREIAPGVEIYARLVLPDNTYVDVQSATVRWCDNGQVGLEISEMERPDALRLLERLSSLGASAITYSKNYNSGPITIGSGQELGRFVAGALRESRPLINVFRSISQHVRAQLARYTDAHLSDAHFTDMRQT